MEQYAVTTIQNAEALETAVSTMGLEQALAYKEEVEKKTTFDTDVTIKPISYIGNHGPMLAGMIEEVEFYAEECFGADLTREEVIEIAGVIVHQCDDLWEIVHDYIRDELITRGHEDNENEEE